MQRLVRRRERCCAASASGLTDQAEQAHQDIERLTKARGELEVSQRQQATIDNEISRLPKDRWEPWCRAIGT